MELGFWYFLIAKILLLNIIIIYFETEFVISDFKNWKVDQITPLKRSYLYLFLMSSVVIDPIGRSLEIFPILVLFPIFHN